jgi:hypothetical protein
LSLSEADSDQRKTKKRPSKFQHDFFSSKKVQQTASLLLPQIFMSSDSQQADGCTSGLVGRDIIGHRQIVIALIAALVEIF